VKPNIDGDHPMVTPADRTGPISVPAWTQLLATEVRHGHERIISADWLDWADWSTDTIITRDGSRVRLVLLNARQPRRGAFTRLMRGIKGAGLMPVLVEPNQVLKDWCARHDWRSREIGRGNDRQLIFYPRREADPNNGDEGWT
jgi:hypothetical protein